MWSDVAQRPAASASAPDAPQRKASPVTSGFLQIDRLSKAYIPAKPVFANVGFTIEKGEFFIIIGHSGCGKTTILNVVWGLDYASWGDSLLDGSEFFVPIL